MSKSVCVATYNGSRYIEAQLASIIMQLDPDDEVIICDDCSTDNTVDLIEKINDSRIKVYKNNKNLGYVRNFEKCISLSKFDYIFLSDQDDVWTPGRVRLMLESMEADPKALMVASNFDLIDAEGRGVGHFRKLGAVKPYRWLQIASIFAGKSPYYGCTFLLRRQALKYCLPIPENIESHDIWLALVVSMLGGVINLPSATLQHRLHDSNVTVRKRRALTVILKSRLVFARALLLRMPLCLGLKIERETTNEKP